MKSVLTLLARFFSRRWLLATVLVVFGVWLCIRLGAWQLDRLDQRRAFNSRVLAQIDQPALPLAGAALRADLGNMEYRQVTVSGAYDHSQQIAITNQSHGNEWGVHLVTPLVIAGSDQAVLVDRGWIPADVYRSDDWSQFNESGDVTVTGVLRRPQVKADWGSRTDAPLTPGEAFRTAWNFVNIAEIDKQVSYELLPAYVQEAPNPAWTGLPYRSHTEVEITEGPHAGYALQWFTFATLLGAGYPFFVYRQERRSAAPSHAPRGNDRPASGPNADSPPSGLKRIG